MNNESVVAAICDDHSFGVRSELVVYHTLFDIPQTKVTKGRKEIVDLPLSDPAPSYFDTLVRVGNMI